MPMGGGEQKPCLAGSPQESRNPAWLAVLENAWSMGLTCGTSDIYVSSELELLAPLNSIATGATGAPTPWPSNGTEAPPVLSCRARRFWHGYGPDWDHFNDNLNNINDYMLSPWPRGLYLNHVLNKYVPNLNK